MRPERLFLTDILAACDEIAAYIAGYDLESFVADSKTRGATLLQFVIIGEAANRTSPELRARYADVRWRDAIDLRNYVAHAYFAVIWSRIWDTATTDVPALRAQVSTILAAEYPDVDDTKE